jgi:hypothetical protein
MDTLHEVMRSTGAEPTADNQVQAVARRDHLTVFREFLDHLDRASRKRAPRKRPMKFGKRNCHTGDSQRA